MASSERGVIMTKHCLKVFGILCVVLVLVIPASAVAKGGPDKEPLIQIYRDSYGVPHIYARNTFDLYYGYGYAIATDRLFQMEMAKRAFTGTVAEALGSAWINYDKGVRSNYWPTSIEQQYNNLPRRDKDIFDGYAAGFNARIGEVLANQATLLPKQFIDYGFLPANWTAVDVIMVFVGTMCNRFSDFNSEIGNAAYLDYLITWYGTTVGWTIFDQTKWLDDPAAPTTVPALTGKKAELPSAVKQARKHTPKAMQHIARSEFERMSADKQMLAKAGLVRIDTVPSTSNVWIVDRTKTTDGSSILLNGPQFGWFNPGYVYEVGLHGAGFNVIGSSPFGYPAVLFGHNGHIAWGSTAGPLDVVDMYEELLSDTNQYVYLFKGEWLPMEKRTDTINVKGESPVTVDVYRTVHGLVTQFDVPNKRAFSKKRSWEGYEVQTLVAWVESTKANNWNQFRRAAEKMAITNNWYYADKTGQIGYISVGMIPLRPATQDSRLPAEGTGDMEWLGIKPFDTNPQVFKPRQGWLANWNNKPSVDTENTDGSLYGSADRVQVIFDELTAKNKFSKEEIWGMNRRISHIDLNIAYFLPFLNEAVEGLLPSAPEKQAVQLLNSWDKYRWDLNDDGYYDSPAQTIMETWLPTMLQMTFQDDTGPYFSRFSSAGYPASPPGGSTNVQSGTKVLYHSLLGPTSSVPNNYDFFNGVDSNQVIRNALTATIGTLTTRFGSSDMATWMSPVVPQKFDYKNFAGVPQANASEVLYLPVNMNRGTQNHMVVFKKAGFEAQNVCPPGQSGFVAPDGSKDPHYEDQMGLYQNFQSKPMILNYRP